MPIPLKYPLNHKDFGIPFFLISIVFLAIKRLGAGKDVHNVFVPVEEGALLALDLQLQVSLQN